jgi:O-Antigen ligase
VTASALAQAGGVIGGVGFALLLVARERMLRLAGLGVLAVGMALFLPLLLPSDRIAVLAAGGAVGALVVAGLAVAFRRYRWSLAFVVMAAAAIRIPVSIGSTSANLLLPLYVVIAAAAVALAWSIWRDQPRRELGFLAWPLAALVLWFGLSGLWTSNVRSAAIFLFFFVLPFGVLTIALARLPWSSLEAGRLFVVAVAIAVVFALVGIWQWAAHDVFWNQDVVAANAYATFYRVNSVFWDPSMYGRFLVLGILAVLTLLLFRTRGGTAVDLALGAAVVILWIGLLFSFSQSSFVALVLAVLLAALLAWRWKALVAVAVLAAVMIPVGVASPQLENVRESLSGSPTATFSEATGGRSTLVSVGVRIVRDNPVAGVGVGGFNDAYAERVSRREAQRTTASHTTPVTVAAETGIVGLALFAWLVGTALFVAFRGSTGADTAGRARLIAGLCLVAIFVHSLFYSAFFEDPLMWIMLAIATIAVSTPPEGVGAGHAPPAEAS